MHSGMYVLSDDSAAIDRQTAQVVSLPFALMLREGSWPILSSYIPELHAAPTFYRNGDYVRFLPPHDHRMIGAAPAQCLLFAHYQPGIPAQVRTLTTLEALLTLQQSGFWVPHDRESIAQFLCWLQSLPAHQLTYSNLSDAIPHVHRLLA
jgi:hypothetical protein